jgi:ABC-2 type transport system permease protein
MTTISAAPPMIGHHRQRTLAQTWAMSKRSILAIARQPALVAPAMIFPLFFAALGTSAFSRAVLLPGFPKVDSFLDFAVAGSITQGVLFGSVTGGAALATDIEQGFFDRLLSTPTSRTSIVMGRLAGGAAFGAFQALFFMVVLLPFGLTIRSGVVGVACVVLAGAITGMSIGGFMAAMGIKTGSAEAVQGSFPLLFIALFFSSAFFPRQTMSGAYRNIANINPVSYLVEGIRGLVIEGLTWPNVAKALLVPLGIGCVSIPLALITLRRRLAAR